MKLFLVSLALTTACTSAGPIRNIDAEVQQLIHQGSTRAEVEAILGPPKEQQWGIRPTDGKKIAVCTYLVRDGYYVVGYVEGLVLTLERQYNDFSTP